MATCTNSVQDDVEKIVVKERYFTQLKFLLIKRLLECPTDSLNDVKRKNIVWVRRNISKFSLGKGVCAGVIWYEKKRKGLDSERYIVVEPDKMDDMIKNVHCDILCHQGWHRTHSFVCFTDYKLILLI